MATSQAFWDKAADRYARSPVSDEATYQRKLAETQEILEPHMRILEFGCGTGTTAIHHAPHVQHVDAIDISENMLNIARTKARDAGVENITFTRGTLEEFGAEDASVDAVLGLNVLHLLPDREQVIGEVGRILKPGGLFVSSTACLANSPWRFVKLVSPLAKAMGLMPDLFILTEQQLASELLQGGFHIERQWHHGRSAAGVFMIARKTQGATRNAPD